MGRPVYLWRLRTRGLELGRRTLVMGTLNVTPDSFSDAGQFFSGERAVARALEMLDEGADLLDIGGESTRPGARVQESGVTAEEELRRIMSVIEDILHHRPRAILSVDTYKAEVARKAITAGAEIVNDVSALRWDQAMPATVAELKCGAVLMHTRGRPEQWRDMRPSPDIVGEVKTELRDFARGALDHGIAKAAIVLDPGFGFGKRFDQNWTLLAGIGLLGELGFPLLAGTSRKSFVGRTVATNGKDAPVDQRVYGSVAAATLSVLEGAHIVRVHDVRASVDAVKVADALLNARAAEAVKQSEH